MWPKGNWSIPELSPSPQQHAGPLPTTHPSWKSFRHLKPAWPKKSSSFPTNLPTEKWQIFSIAVKHLFSVSVKHQYQTSCLCQKHQGQLLSFSCPHPQALDSLCFLNSLRLCLFCTPTDSACSCKYHCVTTIPKQWLGSADPDQAQLSGSFHMSLGVWPMEARLR